MSLLELKNVGKIYVSDDNVTVGIRGVSLSLERGEFVAVTGKSGSGKSTLLNVISGMDTYEEGELLIEGRATSHYIQQDWEKYREKYISFIFQDYNIIDSFTVLENVELALMDIKDTRERRQRALELIDRVGLSSHVRHKGSRLSGGQKQRTVIARALAKDSPIILADEPTGNLDSQSSREIIELLREVSRDKLLIVVTHSFDEVADYATRHIRIFDGSVESDRTIKSVPVTEKTVTEPCDEAYEKNTLRERIRNGFRLGRSIFLSKPKLSIFLSLFMILGALGIFLITTFSGDAGEIFKPHYMFNPIEERVVITTSDGRVMTEEEIEALAERFSAKDYLRYDSLVDLGENSSALIPIGSITRDFIYFSPDCSYGEDIGSVVGRYPKEKNEVLLYLPIYYSDEIGRDSLEITDMLFEGLELKIVGVKYYYDNNRTPKCIFTEEGFRIATAAYFVSKSALLNISLSVETKASSKVTFSRNFHSIIPSFTIPDDKIYIDSKQYHTFLGSFDKVKPEFNTILKISASTYSGSDYNYGGSIGYTGDDVITTGSCYEEFFFDESITQSKPDFKKYVGVAPTESIVISEKLLLEIAETSLMKTYKQSSLFFESKREARRAAEALRDLGYIAVTADTTYEPDVLTTILTTISSLMLIAVWLLFIVFLAFFINLCSTRVLDAFREDMAIMRSMGIPVAVIQIGMYVRMLLSLIPAVVCLIAGAIYIFTSPTLNEYFTFLYPWQYLLIIIGLLILITRITHKQISRLFGRSVKKALRGGAEH